MGNAWDVRVDQLELAGLCRSDAQGVADCEEMQGILQDRINNHVLVEVEHAANGLDFSVRVFRPGIAPQRFENLPIGICLERVGCNAEQIAAHMVNEV